MFGLAVLFFMAIFVLIAGGAMWVGAKIGKGFGDLVHMPFAGAFVGLLCGFMMPTGFLFLGWAKEKIDAETTVAGLCATKAGIRIYLSPEEHARRIRENDWEGVRRAIIEDEVDGPYVFGKIITLDGKQFTASNKRMAGEYGKITAVNEDRRKKHPRHIAHASYLYYDVAHQVPLFRVESFMVTKGGPGPNFRFWIREWYGCYLKIDKRSRQLSERYKH